MNDISALLAEAKPLYFARKRRKQQVKVLFGTVACLVVAFLLPMKKEPASYEGLNTLYADLYDSTVFEKNFGIIEEPTLKKTGLPTDEYGLLKVS
jgi:hypothetical protein